MATLLTTPLTPTVLADIATAQAVRPLYAYEGDYPTQRLADLQALYARRRTQLNLLTRLFHEGAPELTLRGETQQLTLPGQLLGETFSALRESLSEALDQLERDIVRAYQEVAEWAAEDATRPTYAPLVLALCESAVTLPTTPLANRPLPTPALAA